MSKIVSVMGILHNTLLGLRCFKCGKPIYKCEEGWIIEDATVTCVKCKC